MSFAIRRTLLTLVGGVAIAALVACGQPQPAAESGAAAEASSEATQETSSSSEAQPAAPSQPDFAITGDGWGLVYPAYWQGKVTYESLDNPIPEDKTAKGWNIKTDDSNAYDVLVIADVAQEMGTRYLTGGEDDKTEVMARATLGSGQAATIRKVSNGVLVLVAELPNGRWLMVGESDEISSAPSDSRKNELDVRCDLQSFGKKSSWEDYDEAFVQSFLEQIAGYIYATSA